ncbi:MAG: pyridoxamine 5'-phosphate oxidase family protein [Candidatus Bathyarchaeota archaeon]|nr:pyridoxamine 5'-phosphate oxidase family protein [Candidatus Bathyarchaeota archaeon]
MKKLSKSDAAFIQKLPVGRLATATEDCEPIVRPVWPVFDGIYFYIAFEPDSPTLEQLEVNPQVSLVIDDYDRDNWSTAKGICVQGEAEIIWSGKEYQYAHSLLKEKYPAYQTESGSWKEGEVPIIKITTTSYERWQEGKWK